MEAFINFLQNPSNVPLVVNFLVLYLAVLWLAVLAWILRDITTRSQNILIVLATLVFVAIGNLPAVAIYLLLRPEKTLEDAKEKDLFYASILDKEVGSCGHCQSLVRNDYKFCPTCGENLERHCENCGIRVQPTWSFCSNCQIDLRPRRSWFPKFGLGLPAIAGTLRLLTIGLRRIGDGLRTLWARFWRLLGRPWRWARYNWLRLGHAVRLRIQTFKISFSIPDWSRKEKLDLLGGKPATTNRPAEAILKDKADAAEKKKRKRKRRRLQKAK